MRIGGVVSGPVRRQSLSGHVAGVEMGGVPPSRVVPRVVANEPHKCCRCRAAARRQTRKNSTFGRCRVHGKWKSFSQFVHKSWRKVYCEAYRSAISRGARNKKLQLKKKPREPIKPQPPTKKLVQPVAVLETEIRTIFIREGLNSGEGSALLG